MLEFTFFFLLAILIYIYLGYPLIIWLLSRLSSNRIKKSDYTPTVSILISAYNEEACIEQTINNKLEQDYPGDKLEIIIISDESTDNTDRIVQDIADRKQRVKFHRQEPRQGKTAALNTAIEWASGEIIVFSDANSIYEKDAISKLVRNFSDPAVGYVTGKMVYTTGDGSLVGDGCTTYMRYENFIREHETAFNSVVGVDGGIDAVRKELYQPMQPDQLPDFVLPLMVAAGGKRVVYEKDAVLREPSLIDYSQEYRMRVRVSLRALWALYDMRELLNPARFPVFSWQLFSHKVLRYFAWVPLTLLFLVNLFLLDEGAFYVIMFCLQIIAYTLAMVGFVRRDRTGNPFYITLCYYFVLINTAAAMAFYQFINGRKQTIWAPRTG